MKFWIVAAAATAIALGARAQRTAPAPEDREKGDDASFVSQTVPSTLRPEEVASVTIEMKNSGTTKWDSSVRLHSMHWNWHIASREGAESETVEPGATRTFKFSIVAPKNSGELSVPVSSRPEEPLVRRAVAGSDDPSRGSGDGQRREIRFSGDPGPIVEADVLPGVGHDEKHGHDDLDGGGRLRARLPAEIQAGRTGTDPPRSVGLDPLPAAKKRSRSTSKVPPATRKCTGK